MPDTNPSQAVREGLRAYIESYPQLWALEQKARTQYDPQRVAEQLALYDTFDPQFMQIRSGMEKSVLEGVESGYNLPPGLQREVEQNIRGAQAARGNVYGNAPISAEAAVGAKAASDYRNQNLAAAGTFLGMPSPAVPDRAPSYTAGASGVASGFGLAAYNAQQNQPNPWLSWASVAANAAASYYGGGGGGYLG